MIIPNLEIICNVFTEKRENKEIGTPEPFACWLYDFLFDDCFFAANGTSHQRSFNIKKPISNLEECYGVQEYTITKIEGYVGSAFLLDTSIYLLKIKSYLWNMISPTCSKSF